MLRLNPRRFDSLYDKSAMLRLHGSINHDDVFAAYKNFIKAAPCDHRKLPESYYAIAACYILKNNKIEVKSYCNLALEAEKPQKYLQWWQ